MKTAVLAIDRPGQCAPTAAREFVGFAMLVKTAIRVLGSATQADDNQQVTARKGGRVADKTAETAQGGASLGKKAKRRPEDLSPMDLWEKKKKAAEQNLLEVRRIPHSQSRNQAHYQRVLGDAELTMLKVIEEGQQLRMAIAGGREERWIAAWCDQRRSTQAAEVTEARAVRSVREQGTQTAAFLRDGGMVQWQDITKAMRSQVDAEWRQEGNFMRMKE